MADLIAFGQRTIPFASDHLFVLEVQSHGQVLDGSGPILYLAMIAKAASDIKYGVLCMTGEICVSFLERTLGILPCL